MKRKKETLDYAYNNSKLSDLILNIKKKGSSQEKETITSICVSKLHLASKSEFFRQMFINWVPGPEREYDFPLEDDVEVTHFVDLIRAMYQLPLLTSPEELLTVLRLADKYQVDIAIKSCVDVLSQQEKTLENSCTFLELPEQIKKHVTVERFLIKPSSEFVLSKFQRVRDLFRSEAFLNLSVEAVLVLVKSDDLVVDSENSVLYFVMTWIHKEPEKREIHFELFLPHIRFPQMLKYFLLDVVPQVASQFKEPIQSRILQARSIALEYHVAGSRRLHRKMDPGIKRTNPQDPPEIVKRDLANPMDISPQQLIPRATLQDPLRFTIKCIFKEVSRWDLYGRYYSDPVFAHAYEFYFFLRKQRIVAPARNPEPNTNGEATPNPADFTLAGFLRCTSRLMPARHFLPICSTVSILLKGNLERKFTPSRIVFEASEKAIGGKLTIPDENWATIVSGESALVVDNTLTVMVTVEFLSTDEGCQLIDETTSE